MEGGIELKTPSYTTIIDLNNAYYREHAVEYIDSTLLLDMSDKYKMFLKSIPTGGSILDVGCGSGRDSRFFEENGFDVLGIDISPEMVAFCRKNHVHAEVIEINSINFDNQFDGIWACASLLHVPKNRIGDALQRIWKALKPGGKMFVSLKEGDGEVISDDRRFFSYYRADEFRTILAKSGSWSILEEITDHDPAVTWLNFIAVATK